MKRGRKGFKILGVTLLAALGLMAISVSAAQASGHFLVNGAKFDALETVEGTGALGVLLTESGLKIHCEKSDVTGEINHNGEAGKVSAAVLFLGCSVEGNKFCTVYGTEADLEEATNPKMVTATGLGELGLHEASHYVALHGLGKQQLFASLYFGGPLCTLPEEVSVTGLTAFLLPTALKDQVNQSLTTVSLEEEKLLLGFNGLFYGGEPAHLTGGAVTNLHLTGKEAGKTWGAL